MMRREIDTTQFSWEVESEGGRVLVCAVCSLKLGMHRRFDNTLWSAAGHDCVSEMAAKLALFRKTTASAGEG